jgi:hypothetical protein
MIGFRSVVAPGDLGLLSADLDAHWESVSYGSGWQSSPGQFPYFDALGDLFDHSLYQFGERSVDALTGLSNHIPMGFTSFDGFRLRSERYSGSKDKNYPQDFFNQLIGLASPTEIPYKFSKDKLVNHSNMTGVIQRKLDYTPYEFPSYEVDYLGKSFPLLDNLQAPYGSNWGYQSESLITDTLPVGSAATVSGSWRNTGAKALATDLCERVKAYGTSLDYTELSGGRLYHWWLVSFDYVVEPDKLTIHYRYGSSRLDSNASYYEGEWEVECGIELIHTGLTHPLPPPNFHTYGFYAFQARSFYKYSCRRGFTRGLVDGVLRTFDKVPYSSDMLFWEHYGSPWFGGPFVGSTISSNGHLATTTTDVLSIVRSEADKFGDYWTDRLPTLRSTAVFAYQDALAAHFESLNNNYVQTLYGLDGLPGMIPDYKLLLKALTEIKEKNLLGLVKLGDFITSTVLKYNFAISPNQKAVSELNSRGNRIIEVFLDSFKTKTSQFYGSFSFPFLESEAPPYPGSKLVTRCVASVTYTPTPFIIAFANLYGLRLLPSLQNVWETLPFSFAVDWATNMRSRLRYLDLSLMSLMVRANWSEFSYTVSADVPRSNALYESSGKRSQDLKWRWYCRELTLSKPCLYDTDVDFLRVRGSPNTGIFGSLCYQLLYKG